LSLSAVGELYVRAIYAAQAVVVVAGYCGRNGCEAEHDGVGEHHFEEVIWLLSWVALSSLASRVDRKEKEEKREGFLGFYCGDLIAGRH
jgi:hypothetical protein